MLQCQFYSMELTDSVVRRSLDFAFNKVIFKIVRELSEDTYISVTTLEYGLWKNRSVLVRVNSHRGRPIVRRKVTYAERLLI